MTYEDTFEVGRRLSGKDYYEKRLASLIRNAHKLAERAVREHGMVEPVVLSPWMPESGWLRDFYADWRAFESRNQAIPEFTADVPSGKGEVRTFESDYGILRETFDLQTRTERLELIEYFGTTAVESLAA